jgi:pyridoxal phosphate-dependent aminotransferase EpsN
MTRIYLSAPHMSGHEQAFVAQAFESNWLSSVGPNLDAFEAEFSALLGLPAVALSSGTAAIHLGLKLLGVGPGDEVICPTFTFAASVNPVGYLGGRPVFVDSEPTSWNIDPNLVEDALKRRARPKALVVVHLFGQSADLDPIFELSERYGVPVLEDCAEALGTTYRGVAVGTRAPVSAFSFNGNKIITTTGGGMLVARDRSWVEKARYWSTQAREPGPAYSHTEVGYNYRMSNVLAGIGRGQLMVLADRVAARRRIAFTYRDAFAGLDGLELMPQAPWGTATNWLSCFTVDPELSGATRDTIMAALAAEDIEARPLWKPMHLQPLFAGAPTYGGALSEELFERGICLPSSSSLSASEQERVIQVVQRCVRRGRVRRATAEVDEHA